MKLVSCKIANFGKLCNYSHDFSDGLNVILADNGWGKSTLLTFVRAMFYGLPKTTKRNLDENLRNKYQPWQGGNYGGTLTFESEGKQYRIERFFLSGAGKGNDESFALYDVATGKVSKHFASNIGEQIFGVDCDTFVKSACLSQQEVELSATNDITNRLTQLLESSSGDVKDYEVAEGILSDAVKSLKNKHGKGQIPNIVNSLSKVKLDIAHNNSSIDEIDIHTAKLAEMREQLASYTAQLQQVKDKLKESNKVATVAHYLSKVGHLEDTVSKHNKLQVKYGNFTNEQYFAEGIDRHIDIARQLQSQQSTVKALSGNSSTLSIVDADAFLAEVDVNIEQAVRLNQGNIALATNTSGLDSSLCTAQNIQAIDTHINTLSSTSAQSPTKMSVAGLLLAILAILTIVGIPVLLLLRSRKRKASQADSANRVAEVAQFLLQFGISVPADRQLEQLYALRASISSQLEQLEQRQTIRDNCTHLSQLLQTFCSRHGVVVQGQDYHTALTSAKAIVSQQQSSSVQLQSAESSCQQYESQLIQFCNHCRIAVEPDYYTLLTTAKADIAQYLQLGSSIKSQQEEIDQFVSSNNIDITTIDSTADAVDVSSLEAQEAQLASAIDCCKADIDNKQKLIASKTESYSMLQDLKAEQDQLQAELDQAENKYRCLSSALELLAVAKDDLASAYIVPMKNAFAKYYTMLVGQDIEFDMDTELSLRIIAQDKGRDVRYFSEGTKDGIMLSMRFALIEALFVGNQPMVLLDDPFINLDDERLERALQFVDTLSQDRQIVYFTCNTSRMLS